MGVLRETARVGYNLLLLPAALLFRLLARRSPDRWLFSGGGGLRFADNAAWLFLWVLRERPAVKAVWVTRSLPLALRLRRASIPVRLEWTPRGLWTAARARIVVQSHGPGDAYYPAVAGAFVVNLWHGVPIKHIMLDHPPDLAIMQPARPLGRLYQHLRRPGFLRGPDLLMAMTPSGRRRMEQASGLPSARTSDAGFPRLQAFTSAAPPWPFPEDVAMAKELRNGHRLMVLFLPTWGTDPEWRRGLLVGPVLGWLASNDAVLVVKPHPNDPPIVPDPAWSGRVAVAPRTLDALLLMAEADVLVTDVSSALVDMLAAGRPVVLVRTEWGQELRGFYQRPDDFVRTPVATDSQGLAHALEAVAGGGKGRRRAARSNASAEAAKWLPVRLEQSCANVFSDILRRAGGGQGGR